MSLFTAGETNLDALMTSLITSVEEHGIQVETEQREEVSNGKEYSYKAYMALWTIYFCTARAVGTGAYDS